MCVYIYIYIYICIHTYIYIYIYIHHLFGARMGPSALGQGQRSAGVNTKSIKQTSITIKSYNVIMKQYIYIYIYILILILIIIIIIIIIIYNIKYNKLI